jgi:hypothetical protein
MRMSSLRAWAALPVVVFMATAVARADVLYDPPAGSRWTIQIETHAENLGRESGRTDIRKSVTTITAELTVDAKTADGFRMTYARRKSSYNGDVQNVALQRAALAALDNVAMKVTMDRNGRPLRVENVEDIKAALQTMIDRIAAAQEPAAAATIRKMFASMTDIDGVRAASLYLDELGALAAAQNTGLAVGEVRKSVESAGNPIGPTMMKNISLTMVRMDPAKGDARLALTESYEPESIRAFIEHLLKSAGGNPADAKDMALSLEARTDIDVAGGMTRSLRRDSTTSNRRGENSRVTRTRKTVTVTAAN